MVETSAVRVYHLPRYTHQVHVRYIIYLTLFFQNQMHTQGYNNLENYSRFITLEISQKYPHLKLRIFSNLGKFIRVTLT
jgi:hypothetical protein